MKKLGKIDKLALIVQAAWDSIPPERTAYLKYEGPRGGKGANKLPGWGSTGDPVLSRAVNKTNVPTMRWYNNGPRPSVAIPLVLKARVRAWQAGAPLRIATIIAKAENKR